MHEAEIVVSFIPMLALLWGYHFYDVVWPNYLVCSGIIITSSVSRYKINNITVSNCFVIKFFPNMSLNMEFLLHIS